MNERDLFGEPKFKKGYQEAWNAIKRGKKGYVPYEAALDLIRQFSERDPTFPENPFMQEMRLAIADALGFERDVDLDRILVYSAIGSAADIFHGVDAWIEVISTDGKKEALITMDATTDPDKDHWKADLIIPELPDPDTEAESFMQEVAKYASQAVKKLEAQF